MSLVSPRLDDRTWDDLVAEAKLRIEQSCPKWNDLTPHDPGMVLVEVFAYLTEAMIYRLNRVPDKMYVEFLRLLGVQLEPPKAATVKLKFRRERASDAPLTIPGGTHVTIQRASGLSEPPVFETLKDARLPTGDRETGAVEVLAIHAELIKGERLGRGTGQPGQMFTVRHPPIVAPIADDPYSLVIGVEDDQSADQFDAEDVVTWSGRTFRRWREVDQFHGHDDEPVYLVDRVTGTITFAPAVQLRSEGESDSRPRKLAAVPAAGREIRVWYRRGGGPAGNVAAASLSTLKEPIPGVAVTNPEPAAGGCAVESLDNALRRGPLEFRSLQRAVTARDYELGVLGSGAVSRAKAFTKLDIWRHAAPGTVQVLLVPSMDEEFRPGQSVDGGRLAAAESKEALQRTQDVLDRRRPLATICQVDWARYKCVKVEARVIIQDGLDAQSVKQRLLDRVHQTICPVRLSAEHPGWGFGQTLHVSHVYEMCLSEPGVRFVENVRLVPEHEPTENLSAIEADHFQDDTWYVAAGNRLFRSQNNGGGWELVGAFGSPNAPEDITRVVTHPGRAGHVAVVTRASDKFPIYLSADCGTSWRNLWNPDITVWDIAWAQLHDGTPYLLLATDLGLYELLGGAGKLVPVDLTKNQMPLYAVAVHLDLRGDASVAVATQRTRGVHLSREGGKGGSFRPIGASGQDIRCLAFQSRGSRAWLWAGATAVETDPGTGCLRWELGPTKDAPVIDETAFGTEWSFGSCHGFAFVGGRILAASHRGGVVRIEEKEGQTTPAWQSPARNCGLPPAPDGRFAPVHDIAAAGGNIMAITDSGIFLAGGNADSFVDCSQDREKVTLPPTMLFCSGAHSIEVVAEEAVRSVQPPEEQP